MGYSGGTKIDPTYHDLGDHTETIQLDYDPQAITYEQLVDVFWKGHDPATQPSSTQYRSILFYHDEDQKRLAEQSRAALAESRGQAIATDIRPVGTFYRAEDYHQKYTLRSHGELLKEFTAMYPDADDLTDSTAAARINGLLAGAGRVETLCAEIDGYGLSPQGRETLLKSVTGSAEGCTD